MYTSEIIKYASIKAGITDLWQDTLESDTSNKVIKILCNFLDNIDMDVQRSFGYTYTDIVPNNDMLFISNESVSGNPVSACQILDEPCKQTPMIYCNNTELQQIYFPRPRPWPPTSSPGCSRGRSRGSGRPPTTGTPRPTNAAGSATTPTSS